jgi:DNA-binding LytR/AlgR family response regulator
MKALIVEDEFHAVERLQLLLPECDPDLQVTGIIDTIEEAVSYLRSEQKPDLIFLDIELADGKSFSIFEQVEVDIPVIFTTAYDHYALQAFQFFSIDYLLKPIQLESLKNALFKFGRFSGNTKVSKDEISLVRELLKVKKPSYKERFIIKAGNKLQLRPTYDVAYFFADGKAVYLVTKTDNRKYIVDHTLEELETVLDPALFFRISRKFIVCVESLHEVKGLLSGRLEIKIKQDCEHELSVSRERANDFKAWLNR